VFVLNVGILINMNLVLFMYGENYKMSYNCDTWKVKKLKDFKIPVASLFKHSRNDWHPEIIHDADGGVTFEIMSNVCIGGFIKDNWLTVSFIDCSGEGSGIGMNMILEPAFEDSTGELIASCVWEGGDSINRIIVKDGEVSWEDIEI
jgi:hypothetical protein